MQVPIIGSGTERDPRSLALATRAGERIDNIPAIPLTNTVMKARIRTHRQTFPNNILRSAASIYNCVGMVFASRRTAIDVEDVRRILIEDEYLQIRREEAKIGDIVLYMNRRDEPSHVGRIVILTSEQAREINPMRILSQWGEDGEYLHAPHDVPSIYGHPKEYWTDRRNTS